MPADKEEQIAVLFALHCCGGRAPKQRVIHFVLQNDLLRPREEDDEYVQSNEKKIDNDLAWARQSLKYKGLLRMPTHGIWEITEAGQEAIQKIAKRAVGLSSKLEGKAMEEAGFKRLSRTFHEKLVALGRTLS